MDHARRKWVVALDAGDVRAAIVVKLMGGLYAVEAEARAQGLGPDALLELRREKSRPIMEQLRRVIGDLAKGALPKSPRGKATTYTINQWPTLEVFLDVPRRRARVPGEHPHRAAATPDGPRPEELPCSPAPTTAARRVAILQTFVVNCNLAKVPMWQ